MAGLSKLIKYARLYRDDLSMPESWYFYVYGMHNFLEGYTNNMGRCLGALIAAIIGVIIGGVIGYIVGGKSPILAMFLGALIGGAVLGLFALLPGELLEGIGGLFELASCCSLFAAFGVTVVVAIS